MVDLNKIKAKAGINDLPSDRESEAIVEPSRSSGPSGKRRFWFNEQDPSPAVLGEHNQPEQMRIGASKGEQRGSKWVAKGQPNGEQRGSKGVANGERVSAPFQAKGEQRGSKGAAKGQPNGEQENDERGSKGVAKGEQENIPQLAFSKLVGLQRKIALLVYDSMQARGDDLTEPMSSTALAERLSTSRPTIKDALRRLRNKGVLVTAEAKTGNGGWVRYGLPPPVRAEIFTWQRDSKGIAKGQLNGEQTGPSSSSYIENKITPTTTAATRARAEDVWTPEDLDYSMLTDVGFGRSQALQLRSLGLSFDVVQRSLVYFEFELRYTASGKSIQEPLALLMKRMRQNGCWEAPEEYEKRHAHFHTRFAEHEQQLQEKEHAEEKSADFLETDGCITSPSSDVEPLR